MSERYDPQDIKAKLPFLDLMAREGVILRRSGPNWVGPCPFHAERSASFTVHGPEHDHGHCYGCGWNGDVIDFWIARRGVAFVDAVRELASLASVPAAFSRRFQKQASQVPRMTDAKRKGRGKPTLPRLRALTDDEMAALAKLRGIDVDGVRAAVHDKRVGGCSWPQYEDYRGAWGLSADAVPCWVVTDGERRLAQFRKLDGGQFLRFDGQQIKAWTRGSPTWPLGASEIGQRGGVLLVEGGADMLAGYHFLARFGRLRQVAICAMLGGSCSICDEALPFFERKRVRIMMDEDTPKPVRGHPEKPPIYPGREAAARWTAQLVTAGAAVETFSLAGLTKRTGEPVKDLNDLAMVDEGAWIDEELREAFFDFDF